MATLSRVVDAVGKTATLADRLGRAFSTELARVFRSLERKLPPLIADAADGNRTAIVKAAQANQVRKELRERLRLSGYDELADAATGSPLDRLADQVLTTRRLARQSADLSRGIVLRMEALKALQQFDLLDQGDDLSKALWRATFRGVFNARSVDDILDDLSDVIDDTEPHIQTLYDTSVSIYGRQVEALQAGDDPETPFAYMGPADGKTREFCLDHVGKVYTRAQIDALDNGQIDNVFLTGGGYNCRHNWIEVSKFSELYPLVGTPQRIPEVIAQLEQAA